jgi:hypothetical protein
MRLALRSGVQSILDTFDQTPDRREAHGKLQPLLQELCANPQFVFDAFRHFLATPDALSHRRLTLPLFEAATFRLRSTSSHRCVMELTTSPATTSTITAGGCSQVV